MLSMRLTRRPMVAGLALLLGGAMAVAASAAEAPLTLEAAVQQGLARAPQMEARAADGTAAREEAARAGQLPDPVLTFGLANFPVTEPGAFSLRSDGMTARTVGVMQAIPSRSARRAERNLAGARIDAAQADRVAAEQSVRERIADAWIDAWLVEQQRILLADLHDEAALAVRIAQAVEQAGYRRYWVSEHHNMSSLACSAPEILTAHIGAQTERIRVGAAGIMLPNHTALKVADRTEKLQSGASI